MDSFDADGLSPGAREMMRAFDYPTPLNVPIRAQLRHPLYCNPIIVTKNNYYASKGEINTAFQQSLTWKLPSSFSLPASVPLINLGQVAPVSVTEADFCDKALNVYLRERIFAPEHRAIEGFVQFLHRMPGDTPVLWNDHEDMHHSINIGGPIYAFPFELFEIFVEDKDTIFERHDIVEVYYVARKDFPQMKQMMGFRLECIVLPGVGMQCWFYCGHMFIRYYGYRLSNGICSFTGVMTCRGRDLIPYYLPKSEIGYKDTVLYRGYTWRYTFQFFEGEILQAGIINNLCYFGLTYVCRFPLGDMGSSYSTKYKEFVRINPPTKLFIPSAAHDCYFRHLKSKKMGDDILLTSSGYLEDKMSHGNIRWKFYDEIQAMYIEHLHPPGTLSPVNDKNWNLRTIDPSNCSMLVSPHNYRNVGLTPYYWASLRYPSKRLLNSTFKNVVLEWKRTTMSLSHVNLALNIMYEEHFRSQS